MSYDYDLVCVSVHFVKVCMHFLKMILRTENLMRITCDVECESIMRILPKIWENCIVSCVLKDILTNLRFMLSANGNVWKTRSIGL